jgi:hypothetical protein
MGGSCVVTSVDWRAEQLTALLKDQLREGQYNHCDLEIYQVMRTAGQIEMILKLGQKSKVHESKTRR